MAKLKTYRVTGYVTISVELDVQALHNLDAIDKAREELEMSYNLDQSDLFHDLNNGLEWDLETLVYEEEDETGEDD